MDVQICSPLQRVSVSPIRLQVTLSVHLRSSEDVSVKSKRGSQEERPEEKADARMKDVNKTASGTQSQAFFSSDVLIRFASHKDDAEFYLAILA